MLGAFFLAHAREYASSTLAFDAVRNDKSRRTTLGKPLPERFSVNLPHRMRKVGIENLFGVGLRKRPPRRGKQGNKTCVFTQVPHAAQLGRGASERRRRGARRRPDRSGETGRNMGIENLLPHKVRKEPPHRGNRSFNRLKAPFHTDRDDRRGGKWVLRTFAANRFAKHCGTREVRKSKPEISPPRARIHRTPVRNFERSVRQSVSHEVSLPAPDAGFGGFGTSEKECGY